MRQYNPKTELSSEGSCTTTASSFRDIPSGGLKVLVADSDADVCSTLRNLLTGLPDVSIVCFNNAQSLLNYNFDDDIVCLVAEADLPDISGVEVLERLNDSGLHIPTIILAACSDVPTAVRAMQAKAVDFIEKPFVESLLFKRIKQLLQAHKAHI